MHVITFVEDLIRSTQRRRISDANSEPNLFHQKRKDSWLISMPRSRSV